MMNIQMKSQKEGWKHIKASLPRAWACVVGRCTARVVGLELDWANYATSSLHFLISSADRRSLTR